MPQSPTWRNATRSRCAARVDLPRRRVTKVDERTLFNMESKAKLFGHPIHQMLIVFPLGLLATALVFDAIALFTGVGSWSEISFWMIVAGLVGGLLAAPFGLID